ncbi:hypothetical protein [Burkholderia cepacia]|uniref:hypothetical protein n=1 Tax=Burkholderia cepacia TaxID=292 RepID=UPI002ABE84FA|nr:hypothetical protein [Burkholderia cepacia]
MAIDISGELALLEGTTDALLRNATAVRLAQTQRPEVLAALLRLIGRPELVDCRATLVKCLGFYNCVQFFELLIELVAYGNWEVAHEAHALLKSIEQLRGGAVERAFTLIEYFLQRDSVDKWRNELLQDLFLSFE